MTVAPGALVHYHSQPFQLIKDFDYSYKHSRGDKPTGFWVSVAGEDDWPSWCRSEEYGVENLAVPHLVALSDTANILRVSSSAELVEFDAEYGKPVDGWHFDIDWTRLYCEFDGIIIAPYQWSQRLGDLSWYYGWDCASGCIWNLDVIESFTAVGVSV